MRSIWRELALLGLAGTNTRMELRIGPFGLLGIRRRGFTLIELLVVIAVIAILAGLLLPALGKAKAKGRTIDCLNRKHQLALAWMMYAHDNNDRLVRSWGWGISQVEFDRGWQTRFLWVSSYMGWHLAWQITNLVLSTRPDLAALAPYLARNSRPYKCPADTYLSPIQKAAGYEERTRSVSMNAHMGWVIRNFGSLAYRSYRTLGELNTSDASYFWIVMDEHPDTIFVPQFAVYPYGDHVAWTSLPASYHNGGATMFFGDGHAEYKKWLLPETKQPVRYKGMSGYVPPSQDPRDFEWVRTHASELLPEFIPREF